MNDQASTLRMISHKPLLELSTEPMPSPRRARSIAVSAGKGGVGKSNFALNVSLELGKLGKKVILLDADYGLANADLLCGLSPKYHLGHVVSGQKTLEEVTLDLAQNVCLIPGGSGVEELVNFSGSAGNGTGIRLSEMEREHDFIIVDTAAGIGHIVTDVLTSADEVVIVATPEPTSIVDAYATIKVLHRYSPDKPISILVNSVVTLAEANKVFVQLDSAVRNFLKRSVDFLGMIPSDARLQEAVREQIPLVEYAPECPASRALRSIAKQFSQQLNKAQAATKLPPPRSPAIMTTSTALI